MKAITVKSSHCVIINHPNNGYLEYKIGTLIRVKTSTVMMIHTLM